MLLHFTDERGSLESMEVWEGPCLVAALPFRPSSDKKQVNYCCPNGDLYCASGEHAIPRWEAFLVLRECLRTGTLVKDLPEKQTLFRQPVFAGMADMFVPEEQLRAVEWRKVASAAKL
jgi:hypothetical protein